MPIYEYRCKKNGHHFEVIQKISDPPLKTCIHCKSKVEKLISASAFVLKGAGFYVNDYAKKGSGGDKGEKSTKGSKADSKGETKSETKESTSTASESSKPSSDAKSETKSSTPAAAAS